MTKTLYILGAGGHGKVVADAAKKMKQWEEIYFLDDKTIGKKLLGITIKDKITNAKLYNGHNTEYIVAIGDNYGRREIQNSLVEFGCKLGTIIHPFTSIGSDVIIGEGSVLFAGVVVNPSVRIGEGCILNTSSTVDHDSIIENFVHLSPGVNLAGNVNVGNCTWIGIGATVVNNTKITANCTVGAHSLVLNDISHPGVYFGNPIKIMR